MSRFLLTDSAGNFLMPHCFADRWIVLAWALLSLTSIAAAEPPRLQPGSPLRVGIIGLDTSHVVVFTTAINGPKARPELQNMRIVAAFPGGSPDLPDSADRIAGFTADVKKLGVEIVDSIEALLPKVDVVMLESVDGRRHLEQARPVIQARKPLFIDKPLAGSLSDAVEIYRLAREANVPCFSSSRSRFSPSVALIRNDPKIGAVMGCLAYGPCPLEPHHPDLFWYGIHSVETLYAIMGPGCVSVSRVHTPDTDEVTGVWRDGRVGTVRGLRSGKAEYGALVFGSKGIGPLGPRGTHEPLLAEIARFFRTGKPPVAAEETLELFAFMEAADESKRRDGAPATLESAMERAQAARSGASTADVQRSDTNAILWNAIKPFFRPPPGLEGEMGTYRSPLKFYDGRPVTTPAEWAERREEILRYWHWAMGPWPALLAKPRLETSEPQIRDNVTQYRMRIEAAAGVMQDGYLLVPTGCTGPLPAVLVPFYEPETAIGNNPKRLRRDFAYQLARRGFVTMAIGNPGGADYRALLSSAPCQGASYLAYVAANCHTALSQLSMVDPKRIGVVGHSHGGAWAEFASCLYDKFACGVWLDPGIVFESDRPSTNYFDTWYLGADPVQKRMNGLPSKNNPLTGAYAKLVAGRHDFIELHALMAPRPFMVSGGVEDTVARWPALNHAIAVNRLLGFEDRVAMTNRPTHNPNDESNEQMYLFFEHFLRPPMTKAEAEVEVMRLTEASARLRSPAEQYKESLDLAELAERFPQAKRSPNWNSGFSHPPALFAGDFGRFNSTLDYYDGRTLASASQWPERRAEILRYWNWALGPWPALLPDPKLEILDSEPRGDVVQHRIRIEVVAGVEEKGYLLVPAAKKGRLPAVFVPAEFPDAAVGLDPDRPFCDFAWRLAGQGFVTLTIGPPGGDARHPQLSGARCQPLSYLAYIAANCHTALANLSEVDPQRIGIVGKDYGGKWSMFASCLYDKWACAVWAEAGIVFDEKRPKNDYWEPWYLGYDPARLRRPGLITAANPRTGAYARIVAAGHDLTELHALMAPRPFFVVGANEDNFGRWPALNRTIEVNHFLGAENRVAMANHSSHFWPSDELLDQVGKYFERFLAPPARPTP